MTLFFLVLYFLTTQSHLVFPRPSLCAAVYPLFSKCSDFLLSLCILIHPVLYYLSYSLFTALNLSFSLYQGARLL